MVTYGALPLSEAEYGAVRGCSGALCGVARKAGAGGVLIRRFFPVRAYDEAGGGVVYVAGVRF